MSSNQKVLLIIPTHDHPTTLPFSIKSALNQTHKNLEIVVIGDGVTSDTREVMAEIVTTHPHLSFFDKPKATRHGEEYRDQVIRDSDADYVCYLGDDDLLFPNHVENMLYQIVDADFANPLPMFIEPDGTLSYLATDLSLNASTAWHLSEKPIRNSVSLTGVMHSRSSYLRLPFGWRPAPPGIPSDLYMWHQYFRLPGFKASTAYVSTTAKFAASTRAIMSARERAEELEEFTQHLKRPGFVAEWNYRVQEAIRNSAVASHLLVDKLEIEKINLNQSMNQILNSVSWRSTAPIRKLLTVLFR